MITTKTLLRLVRAAMKVELPQVGLQGHNGCYVHVDDFDAYTKQVKELHATLEKLKKEGATKKKGKR